LLPIILKFRLMSTAAAGWTAAASPVPVPAEAMATLIAANTSGPVEVDLYDENDHQKGRIAIWRDGSVDDETRVVVKRLFRCRKTHREAMIHHTTLAMLADIAERYAGKTIEYVSAYRAHREESKTSPHRDARAYIHIDSRPTLHDMSWTFVNGHNRYHPYWSELARRPKDVDKERRAHARRSGS
jgi:hypothetical protein